MGPEERGHRPVADKLGNNISIVHRWSTQNSWVQRVLTWDDHLDKIQQGALEKAAKDQAKNIINLGVGYLQAFSKRLEKQLQAEESGKTFANAIPLNPQGFVAVSRLMVELSGLMDERSESSLSAGDEGQSRLLKAEDIVRAALELQGAEGKDVSAKEAVIHALAGKYGGKRLGLETARDVDFVEVENETDANKSSSQGECIDAPDRSEKGSDVASESATSDDDSTNESESDK